MSSSLQFNNTLSQFRVICALITLLYRSNDAEYVFAGKSCFDTVNPVHESANSFTAPRDGGINGIKLVYDSGEVFCNIDRSTDASTNWGCQSGEFMVVFVYKSEGDTSYTLIYPTANTNGVSTHFIEWSCTQGCDVWKYLLEGYTPYSTEIELIDNIDTVSVSSTDGKRYSLQYSEGCCHQSTGDNKGTVCATVYFHYINFDSTSNPTLKPTVHPTPNPTVKPITNPTLQPTPNPTVNPTVNTTPIPTVNQTTTLSLDATLNPTMNPALNPTTNPTNQTNPIQVPTQNTSYSAGIDKQPSSTQIILLNDTAFIVVAIILSLILVALLVLIGLKIVECKKQNRPSIKYKSVTTTETELIYDTTSNKPETDNNIAKAII